MGGKGRKSARNQPMPNDVLLIIDVQAGFINGFTDHLPEKMGPLAARFDHVAATRFVNPPESPYRRLMGWERFAPESADCELAFDPGPNMPVFDKATYSALTNSVTAFLSMRKPDRVVLAGVATDNCILKTAVDLFETGTTPIILTDHVASHGGTEAHQCGLLVIKRFIGERQLIELKDL